jgi:hypothetical protein
MSMGAFVTLLSGAFAVVAGLLLYFRLVPRNFPWGFCFPPALESDDRWYAINTYGGRLLVLCGLPLVVAGSAGYFVPANFHFLYIYLSPFTAPFAFIVPWALTYRWSRRFRA